MLHGPDADEMLCSSCLGLFLVLPPSFYPWGALCSMCWLPCCQGCSSASGSAANRHLMCQGSEAEWEPLLDVQLWRHIVSRFLSPSTEGTWN